MKIIFVGMPACGKSRMAKIISKEFNLPLFDSDDFIERKYKMSITKLFSLVGEKGFRKLEHEALKEILRKEKYVLATGGGLPCFYNNMDLINLAGETFFLNVDLKLIFKRLKKFREKRPLLSKLNDKNLFDYLENMYKLRKKYYLKAKYNFTESSKILIDFIKNKNYFENSNTIN